MTDEELRSLVRDSVARHLAQRPGERPGERLSPSVAPSSTAHASFYRYALPSGSDIEGPCLIEPGVPCNHCGYCLSHGH